jgi:DNA-binding response OmpR family regulator
VKILIVDDEHDLLEAMAAAARFYWHDAVVLTAGGGQEAVTLFCEQRPDVVVLDRTLGGTDGLAVLRDIRRVSHTPVLVLGALESEADQVRALEAGADDYALKPVGHMALLARIKALVRRAQATPARALPPLEAGHLRVDFAAQHVWVDGQPVVLGDREYKLLYHLARNTGRVLSSATLAAWVWGPGWGAGAADVKALVHRLRAKLAGADGTGADMIENTRGRGYSFVPPTPMTPTADEPVDETVAARRPRAHRNPDHHTVGAAGLTLQVRPGRIVPSRRWSDLTAPRRFVSSDTVRFDHPAPDRVPYRHCEPARSA